MQKPNFWLFCKLIDSFPNVDAVCKTHSMNQTILFHVFNSWLYYLSLELKIRSLSLKMVLNFFR